MKLVPLPTYNEQLPEPNWTKLLSIPALRKVAAAAWRATIAEMTSAGTLSPSNANTIKRYCIALASYDEAAGHVAEQGAVIPSPNGTPQYNPWFTVMKQTDEIASGHEAELGLTPRRRGQVTKTKATKATTGADAFLNR